MTRVEDPRLLPLAFSMMRHSDMRLLRHLQEQGIGMREFFGLPDHELAEKAGLRTVSKLDDLSRREAVGRAAEELDFCDRHRIRVLLPDDDCFPSRLLELPDSPTALFQLGECDLNARRVVSVVGTRTPTPYGLHFAATLVEDIASIGRTLIVSGLAYGIDTAAHQASLEAGLPTVAVVAHGLDTIYPASNRDLARRIVKEGGAVVSEYPHGEKPYRGRFLERNRIVAALADACVVVESEVKGGAMSTASVAFGLDREVMALPGRISDKFSAGCNHLIGRNRAWLINGGRDLARIMNWKSECGVDAAGTRSLFPELDEPQRSIYDALAGSMEPLSIDELHQRLSLPVAVLMAQLGEMEFDGLVMKYPGNRYHHC